MMGRGLEGWRSGKGSLGAGSGRTSEAVGCETRDCVRERRHCREQEHGERQGDSRRFCVR